MLFKINLLSVAFLCVAVVLVAGLAHAVLVACACECVPDGARAIPVV